ncbi:MAG: PorT family protein [Bacteroidales bacterium]|jgi:hypothetical protein|nr:PorT family protein [Bacteroidales bacterium]
MFRKINIVIVLLLAAGAVFGQSSNTRFGIFFDPVVTWLRSDVSDVTRDKARLGFDLGMSADIYFAKNYAFATGISLLNTGGTLKYSNEITLRTKDGNVPLHPDTRVSYKIQYIKLPVAFKFKTHMIGRITYSANMGFDPMVRVSTRADFNDLKNVKATRETKLFNLGWHFGVGAQYSLGGEAAIFGGLSFMNTFMDITKPQHDRITSNNLVFRIGVMF